MQPDRQPQDERDQYWWETITEEDRKRHQEYTEYLNSVYSAELFDPKITRLVNRS